MEGEIMSNKKQRRTNKFGIYLIYSLTFVSYISLCLFYEILPLLLDTDKFNQSKRNKNPNMISFQSAVFIILTSSGFLIYRRLKSNPKVLLIFANILIAFPFRLLSSILVEVAGCDEIDLKIIVHSIEFILRWTIHLSNKPHNMQVLTSVSALLFALMEFTVYLQASISLILYYLGNLMFMVVFAVLYERYSELCSMIIFKNALNKVKQGVFIIDKNSFSPLYCNSYISDIIEMKYSNFQNSGNLALNDMPTETSSFVTSILKNLDLKKNLLSRDPSSTNGKILQKFIAFVIFSIYEISMSESLREFFIQNEAKIDQELNALNLSSNDDPISEQALSLLDSIVNIIVSDYESSYSLPIDEDQNSKSFVKIGSFAFELADFQDDRKIILNKVLSRSDKRNFSSGNFNVDSLLFYDLSIYVDEQNMIHFQVKSINKEKELEVEKKKLETKILFLSKIVHEFKNPLITIGTLCDLIADGKEKLDFYNSSALPSLSKFPSSQSTNSNELKYLSSLSDYLMFLVEDLNVFAKAHLKSNEPLYNKDHKSHAALKEVDLISCLDFSINIYKFRQKYDDNKKQLKIVSDIHPNLYKTFITNETKLKQVIINILSNAYKFTTCGRITLRAENYKEEDSMDAQLNKPKLGKTTENLITKRKAIKISISDTGNGMSKEEIDSLFKPFTTLERNIEQNTHGSGLGLLIIQEFLNEMNSELQIESKLNEGSTFSFVLTEPIRADGMFKQTSKESKSSLKNSSDISFVTCNSDSNDSLYLENVFHKSLLNLMNNINSNPVKQRTSTQFLSNSIIRINSNKNILSRNTQFVLENRSRSIMAQNPINEDLDEMDQIDSPIKTNKHMSTFNSRNSKQEKADQASVGSQENHGTPGLNINEEENISSGESHGNDESSICKEELQHYINDINFKYQQEKESKINESMNNDNSAKIILCDDEAIILKAVEIAIKKVYSKNNKKVFIETSSNGIECLYKIYHDYRFKGIKYDLLIIDENMDYLKGSQVTSILKGLVEVKQLNELRIFSATGHEDEISLNRIKKFGCDGFIGKPIKATDITSTLTQLNLI